MKYILNLILSFLFFLPLHSQAPDKLTSGEIFQKLEKLNFLGSVLYVAAHPDDENTRLISYFSNAVHANTAYLSLTRGDGGQNLIGPEIREQLGVMRTQELLQARAIDGGKQFFTRANDFGYSKHPDETFAIWNKKEVMSDVVWTIRKFRPDVIVNRFDHRSPGSTHGHHTGSAMLSVEAFDLTNDKSVYPEQLKYVETWQPTRLFFNTSWWFYGSRDKFEEADKSNLVAVDAGVYYPILGKSNTEIAAEARSMHKCQGFGSSGTRGSESEYMEFLKGDRPTEMKDPFEGINTTWSRVKGGKPIGEAVSKIIKEFNFEKPYESVVELVNVRKMVSSISDEHWKETKLAEVDEIIQQCLGLFAEVRVNNPSASPGEKLSANIEIINRAPIDLKLVSINLTPGEQELNVNEILENNKRFNTKLDFSIPKDAPYSSAYWLNSDATLGMYSVKDQLLRGTPENKPPYTATYTFEIDGNTFSVTSAIIYKTSDPVKGEVYEPFEIIPAFSVKLLSEVFIFPDAQSKDITVVVKAGKNDVKGSLELCHPNGWTVSPAKYEVEIADKGAEKVFKFEVTPPKDQDENFIVPLIFDTDSVSYTNEVSLIKYDHIPTQTVISDASAKVVKLDIQIRGKKVAYIMGAGDKIPESLEQIGYQVDVIDIDEASVENLSKFDALILGVRAYNTVDRIQFYHDNFLEYVKQGGTMIVQYNTNRGTRVDELGPYPMKLSRDRVTNENAEVRMLLPEHEVLNYPNKITQKDFENWQQERGLYFPNEWADQYDAILSSNDPGEDPKNGGLLVAKYGEGYYIYTGYSWFRELPPGVAGAYRIFANLVSIGKYDRP
ncbi:PIG-L family deacetylase [Portibacter lacus]|uniref:PIG-L domain-containing protein n=1 Tax=Portibacter lacus TaxID=1099794 RepID=A0AA37WDD0_9BACT|nr:PIG-L family deacetylase [Portibacter lacus]GLR15659.1 PIG-L domain-containing protein [Portibacter lacus]